MTRLDELDHGEPGLRRWLHAFPPLSLEGSAQAGRRDIRGGRDPRSAATVVGGQSLLILRRVAGLAWRATRRLCTWIPEVVAATTLDTLDRFRTHPPSILRMEPGEDAMADSRAVAVMVQYSPSGTISDMVLHQIAAYRDLGFAVVLVSNSPTFPEDAWQAARRCAALVVHRRNHGLDFGAWKDVVPEAMSRWPKAEELLIVNDSVLGPIRPLAPIMEAIREDGAGFFGMLESTQGRPHLQSWFLLARGRAAVADAAAFVTGIRLSRSKWKIIQRGELRFARHMRGKGHRVAAVHGYEKLVDLALGDPASRAYLNRAIPLWMGAARMSDVRRLLLARPVNPAHHLWRVLSGPAGCPFIKTELVRRNPGHLPDVETWPDLVPRDSPCPPQMLRDHLAGLGP